MAALFNIIKATVPPGLRKAGKALAPRWVLPKGVKGAEELAFWEDWVRQNGTEPESDYYRKFMMSMGDIKDQSFFDGLVCLDIGCGPKGSLTWLTNARFAIGVDPLAEVYTRFGIDRHQMLYLASPAEHVPLPSHYVDVVFSMNSLDHVDDLTAACNEVRRVLKPGGYFIGSLNLNEPPTHTEPWTLTEKLLEKILFSGWNREYYAVRPRLADPRPFGPYRYFFEECSEEILNTPGPQALWCRFRVPSAVQAANSRMQPTPTSTSR